MHETAGVHSACLHSIIHERGWIIHGYYVGRRKTADDNGGEQTNAVFLCLSRCINLRRPRREDDLSAAAGREELWNVEVTFEVYEPAAAPFAKCSAWTRVASYHPSIRLLLTQCPTLAWVTNTLNADVGLSSPRPATFQHICAPKAVEQTLNVCISARIHKKQTRELSWHQFGLQILISQWFVGEKWTFNKITTSTGLKFKVACKLTLLLCKIPFQNMLFYVPKKLTFHLEKTAFPASETTIIDDIIKSSCF